LLQEASALPPPHFSSAGRGPASAGWTPYIHLPSGILAKIDIGGVNKPRIYTGFPFENYRCLG
jgi:hypothetical protein